ncbi:flagellar hook protein FlgE [Thiohalobacter thiocyanaticus]|uniref:Flagellar hook protein FlgE n=1 Tax=Thiohalobacter thiocyanaticus TaxID=585455 RepID=A0A426QGR8_9GAMM|nr:flagellar hook protein FlgE [Thiohalobacter thiocyanaticus]RRQ20942.1 flagellar hook protein FlgE [Thiohalobacter thiocyanaticus]
MPFSIALSGLNAASKDLEVTGNNIANSSTNGFKSSRTEFADVFAVSTGGVSSTAIGSGVRLANVAQEFGQGNIDFTSSNLDLAINGEGFFVLSDGGSQVYSRAGAYNIDRNGYVVNSTGQRLQVFDPIGNSSDTFNTGSLNDLQVSQTEGAPRATSSIGLNMNLDSSDPAIPSGVTPLDPTDATTYNFSTSFSVFDSQGVEHSATTYFQKQANNQWDARLYLNGTDPGDVVQVGGSDTFSFEFDNNGQLISNSGTPALNGTEVIFDAKNPGTGAADLNMTMDLADLVQFGGDYTVNSLSQDGFAKGKLSGLSISDEGVISARFTNGQSNALGKVALASFPNPTELRQVGDTNWAETFSSGQPLVGEPGSGSLGAIQSGALESSNVDIAAELIKLITAQRNFQANSQVISTADTITQTIINIR